MLEYTQNFTFESERRSSAEFSSKDSFGHYKLLRLETIDFSQLGNEMSIQNSKTQFQLLYAELQLNFTFERYGRRTLKLHVAGKCKVKCRFCLIFGFQGLSRPRSTHFSQMGDKESILLQKHSLNFYMLNTRKTSHFTFQPNYK